jgi:hypothetical protein
MSIQAAASASLPLDIASGRLQRSGALTASGSDANAASSANSAKSQNSASTKPGELSAAAQQQVAELREVDRKVRAHEQAHIAVGRELIRGGPSYQYQTGPDNRRYAVGGEVSIDTSSAASPAKTISKAEHIRATALAPAEPSAQDRSVAAQASSMASDARIELTVQQREEAAEASRDAEANAVQGGASLYGGVAQSGEGGNRLGGLLDSFA